MNEDELKQVIRSQPFEPVRLHLSNGAAFEVRHPDAIAIARRTSGIVVGSGIQVISNRHITHVEPLEATAR